MIERYLIDTKPPLAKETLVAFEHSLGASLPDGLRNLLLASNGGRFQMMDFVVEVPWTNTYTVHPVHLMHIGSPKEPDLYKHLNLYGNLEPGWRGHTWPSATLPFGTADSDYLLVDVSEAGHGAVHVWVSDLYVDDDHVDGTHTLNNSECTRQLAPSFDAFLDRFENVKLR